MTTSRMSVVLECPAAGDTDVVQALALSVVR